MFMFKVSPQMRKDLKQEDTYDILPIRHFPIDSLRFIINQFNIIIATAKFKILLNKILQFWH